MENHKLATLVVTSIFAVLSNNQLLDQNQCDDSCVFETAMKPFELKTCGQCNQPKSTIKS